MTEKHKEIATKIISILRNKGLVARFEIAKQVNIGQYKNDLSTVIETLKEDGLISETSHHVYKITTKGFLFESFEKLEEEMSLETRLAESNIKANELQKIIADRNEQNEIKNRKHKMVNTIVTIILCLLTAIQVILLIQQS